MVDKDEVAIIKIVGGRLAEARELCKLPRHVAADRLGIPDDLLAKIESGVDVETIPLKLIRLGSLIFDVSVDYLLGFSDDWETDPKTRQDREFGAYIHQEQNKLFSCWAAKQLRLEKQLQALTAAVDALRLEVAEIFEALDTFKELNPDFNHLPGGSMIQYRVNRANQAAKHAYLSLLRCKAVP